MRTSRNRERHRENKPPDEEEEEEEEEVVVEQLSDFAGEVRSVEWAVGGCSSAGGKELDDGEVSVVEEYSRDRTFLR